MYHLAEIQLRDYDYSIFVTEDAKKDIKRYCKKNAKARKIVEKKLEEIRHNPTAYGEPLGSDMKGKYSVHIDSSFVLVYSIDNEAREVRVLKYDTHDKAYGI